MITKAESRGEKNNSQNGLKVPSRLTWLPDTPVRLQQDRSHLSRKHGSCWLRQRNPTWGSKPGKKDAHVTGIPGSRISRGSRNYSKLWRRAVRTKTPGRAGVRCSRWSWPQEAPTSGACGCGGSSFATCGATEDPGRCSISTRTWDAANTHREGTSFWGPASLWPCFQRMRHNVDLGSAGGIYWIWKYKKRESLGYSRVTCLSFFFFASSRSLVSQFIIDFCCPGVAEPTGRDAGGQSACLHLKDRTVTNRGWAAGLPSLLTKVLCTLGGGDTLCPLPGKEVRGSWCFQGPFPSFLNQGHQEWVKWHIWGQADLSGHRSLRKQL